MQDPSSFIKTQFPEQEQLKCPRCDSNNTKFCYYNNYNLSQPRHFCKNCKRYWTKGGALRNIPVGGGTRKNSKKPTTSTTTTTAIKKTPNPDPGPTRKVHEATTLSTTTDNNNVSSSNIKPVTMTLGNLGGADNDPTRIYGLGQDRKMLDDDVGGSFSSLLASSHGQFGGLLEGLNPNLNGSALKMIHLGEFGQDLSSGLDLSTGRETGININGGGPGVGGGGGNYLGMQIGGGGAAGVGDDDGEDSSWGGGGGGTDNGWPDLAIYTPGSNY
ncbi:hypothetical protein ACFE04_008458 [Oxalis oulophora]